MTKSAREDVLERRVLRLERALRTIYRLQSEGLSSGDEWKVINHAIYNVMSDKRLRVRRD